MTVLVSVDANHEVNVVCQRAHHRSPWCSRDGSEPEKSDGKTVMSHDDDVDGQAPHEASISSRVRRR